MTSSYNYNSTYDVVEHSYSALALHVWDRWKAKATCAVRQYLRTGRLFSHSLYFPTQGAWIDHDYVPQVMPMVTMSSLIYSISVWPHSIFTHSDLVTV